MMKKVLVAIADGSEEIEAVTVIDVLVRAGAEVTVASVMPTNQIIASRGVKITADTSIRNCVNQEWQLVVLPGGIPGAEHLANSADLLSIVKTQINSDRLLAAICAAPAVVLGRNGLLLKKSATCHPSFWPELKTQVLQAEKSRVVVDKNLVTSQAPGTAMEFALKLVELLFDLKIAKQIAEPMVVAAP